MARRKRLEAWVVFDTGESDPWLDTFADAKAATEMAVQWSEDGYGPQSVARLVECGPDEVVVSKAELRALRKTRRRIDKQLRFAEAACAHLPSEWSQVGSTRRGHRFLVLSTGRLANISECGNVRPPLAHMPMTRDTVRCSTCARLGEAKGRK